jgi:hypothetical protein
LIRRNGSVFLFSKAPTPSQGTRPAYSLMITDEFAGVGRPKRKADHSFSSITEVKNVWRYTFASQYLLQKWVPEDFWGKERPACKADNLNAIYEPIV